MRRIIGWAAGFLIVAGLCISGWNLTKWWESKQSVHTINAHADPKVEKVDQQKKESPVRNPQHSKHEEPKKDFSTLDTDQKTGSDVAELVIPKLNLSYDVFWGTDQNTLKEGVGMYVSQWTTVPNKVGGHTVLSGHRDTVFTKLGDLDKGDTLKVKYRDHTYQYHIKKIWITDPDDRTVIVKKKEPTLTLTTCYPFHYIGHAPKRYIVQADLQ